MSAISTQNMGDGFVQGYSLADQSFNRHKQTAIMEDQAAIANEERTANRAESNARLTLSQDAQAQQAKHYTAMESEASKRTALADNQQTMTANHYQAIEENSKKQLAMANQQFEEAKKSKHRLELKERAKEQFITFPYSQQIDVELDRELEKEGMDSLRLTNYADPSYINKNMQLGEVLNQVKSGNLTYVNSPAGIEVLNDVYSDQIKRNVGEEVGKDAAGNPIQITDKKLTRFDLGPNGSYVANLLVKRSDGKHYEAPITLNRSSDPSDHVKLNSIGDLLDDAQGRYSLAKLASSPEFQNKIQSAATALYTTQNKLPKSAQVQNAEWLLLNKDNPAALAAYAKANPAKGKSKADFVGDMIKQQTKEQSSAFYPDDQSRMTPDAMVKAYGDIYDKISGANGNQGDTVLGEQNNIQQIMQANPGWDAAKSKAYLQHLKSQGQL